MLPKRQAAQLVGARYRVRARVRADASGRMIMSAKEGDVGPTGIKDKGKQRAEPEIRPSGSSLQDKVCVSPELDLELGDALEEALETPLPPPKASTSLTSSSFSRPSPIALPPQAHYPVHPAPPRLLSQLTRSTLPTASLSYATTPTLRAGFPAGSSDPRRVATHTGIPQNGESSRSPARQRTITPLTDGDSFYPDLNPETGLPIEPSAKNETMTDDGAPSLYLQRTITDLLSTPPRPSSDLATYLPKFQLPSLTFPGRTSFDDGTGQRRSFSSSAAGEEWYWPSGWWGKNKGKVDRLVSEEDQADTVEEEKAGIQRKYRTPKNPVVFCHGLLGFDYLGPASLPPLQISHWRGIREVLESNGVEVLIGRVPATASIADRAAALEEMISAKYPGRDVNLIGHSMGGLDCRYLISSMKPKNFHPVSLTTIATPHRGSPFADYVIDNVIGRERLPSLLSLVETLKLPDAGDGSAFSALQTTAMAKFNAEVLDRDDVKYYSWGASFEPGLLHTFRWPYTVILAKEGPNDGLVSVSSAKWGEYRGTLMGVNHLDLVGWVNTLRYAFFEWSGSPIAFKPATFYLEIADYLAEQGF